MTARTAGFKTGKTETVISTDVMAQSYTLTGADLSKHNSGFIVTENKNATRVPFQSLFNGVNLIITL